jgi:ABC-type multidrug transport system fused ATPase/permease subunit
VFIWRYGIHLRSAIKQKRAKEGDVAGFAQEIVHGLSTTKGLGHEQQMRQHFGAVNAESLKAGVHATRTAVGMERVLQIAQGIAVALVTGGGALLVVRGRLSIGELTIFVTYITQLLKPVEKINELASAFSRGLVSGERLLSLLDRCPSIQDAPNAVTLTKVEGVLDLHDVSFRHSTSKEDEGSWILRGVTMHVEPGRLTVLIGESGSGKSTLLYLLARFFDPSSGEITLDGRPFPHIAVNSLRSQITLMLQDTHLFAGTLRMALTPPAQSDIADSALWEALSLVRLDSFIRTLPLGLDTEVGENAINFSGGQRRRVSLARAFLLKRPILLLDEPLANVDEESESAIIQALEQIRVGRTCVVATHTPALIERADDIICLKNGAIAPNFISSSPMLTASADPS